MRSLLLAGLGAAVVVVLVAVVSATLLTPRGDDAATRFHGTPYFDEEPAPDVELVDHTGSPFRLSDLRGEATLLFFGFTHCPDICPLTLDKLARARERLGRTASDLRIVLVTVDPERDDPATLARYVRHFGDGVIGTTGDAGALDRLYREYGVWVHAPEQGEALAGHGGHGAHDHGGEHADHAAAAEGRTPEGEAARAMLTHSSPVYGLDRQGRLRVIIPLEANEDEALHDMRALLAG
jgi:protein SCO1